MIVRSIRDNDIRPRGGSHTSRTGNQVYKGPWYDANLPYISMHTLRDKSAHDRRRRIWDRGFGAKGLSIP